MPDMSLTDSLARLTGEEQKAVKTTAFVSAQLPVPGDQLQLATNHSPLATNHQPLATNHYPLSFHKGLTMNNANDFWEDRQ